MFAVDFLTAVTKSVVKAGSEEIEGIKSLLAKDFGIEVTG